MNQLSGYIKEQRVKSKTRSFIQDKLASSNGQSYKPQYEYGACIVKHNTDGQKIPGKRGEARDKRSSGM